MTFKIFLTFVVTGTAACFCAQAQQTVKITPSNIAYLEYLPQGYNGNSNLYPLVVSLHGIKERGPVSTDPEVLRKAAITVANVGLPKYVKNGKQYPFILISPQLKTSYGTWPAAYVLEVLNYARKALRVDPRRIYITGLSLGGFGAWTTLGAYPEVFAAAVPICAGGNALSKACAIAAENVAVWGFHGDKDAVVSYTVTTKMVNAINACTPKPNPLAKATLFAGMGHGVWDKVYNETNALGWMLTFTNGSAPPANNLPPVVNAGADIVEYLPANTAECKGSASDPDGTVAAYSWSQVSGPSAATLENRTTASLKASNLKAGTYTFRLKATDNKGASANDDVKVVVNSTTTSSAPVVSAGADKSLTLPANSVYLQGSASDPDGIASYVWTKISGGAATLGGQSTLTLHAYSLVAGTYVFRLTVKDSKGNSKYDDVKVSVLASTSNAAPVANAGPDRTLVLPANSISLYGSAKDSDGPIVSYNWTQYGGTRVPIGSANSPTAVISGLKEGKYYFRLTVKDDRGASDYDNVLVKVTSGRVSVISQDGFDSMLATAN